MLDVEGDLNCIAPGGNLLFVSKGRIHMPNRRNTINGMSQATVLELADQLGIPWEEGDFIYIMRAKRLPQKLAAACCP